MQQERNRVIEGMQEWKQKEQLIADLFSQGATRSRHVQQLKLDHLQEMRRTLGNSLSKDERIVLRILRGEITQLYQQLYPTPFVRLVVHLARLVKSLGKMVQKKTAAQAPEWKLKVSKELLPTQKQPVKLQQKVAIRPTLVQQKKVAQRKSMKIRR